MARKTPPPMMGEGSPADMQQDAAGAASAGMSPAAFEGSPQDEAADAAMKGAQPTAMGQPADAEPPHLVGGQRGPAPHSHRDGGRHAPNHGGTHRGHEPSGQHRHHALNKGFGH